MPVEMTLKFPLDQQSLADAAEIIQSLQEQFGERPPDEDDTPEASGAVTVDPVRPPPLPPAAAANAAEFVERWLPHLGPGSRSFWRMAADYARTHANFTFEDLARHFTIAKGTLRSYHRNSYRAIRDESAPDPMPGLWDAQTRASVYWMPEAVRDRILELTRDDPR